MADHQDKINRLTERLTDLSNKQEGLSTEIDALRKEIEGLRGVRADEMKAAEPIESSEKQKTETDLWPDAQDITALKVILPIHEEKTSKSGYKYIEFPIYRGNRVFTGVFGDNGRFAVQDEKKNIISKGNFKDNGRSLLVQPGGRNAGTYHDPDFISNLSNAVGLGPLSLESPKDPVAPVAEERVKSRSSVERFIGENLITVIGVIIVLIGVVFGVKYSIEHDLISPATRIILSYMLGLAVLFAGFYFRRKYEVFGLVLASGAMSILYFVTFAAYSFYQMIPQVPAFGMMVLFTVFTVYLAIKFNRQIIAHIGLVGSYAVPFLLSDGSGNVLALFIYMAIINAGILVIAFKKYWKLLYYASFLFTWMIFGAWYISSFDYAEHFTLGLTFSLIYFISFYATFLAYKIIHKERYQYDDLVLIISNSAIYYGSSYAMISHHPEGLDFLGLFTVGTGLIHFIAAGILYRKNNEDRNLYSLCAGMALVFVTIAVPVQFDGSWVTLLWTGEAVLLFGIGRTRNLLAYELLAYPVMLVALLSLFYDSLMFYYFGGMSEDIEEGTRAFLNVNFYSSLLICAAFGGIYLLNRSKKYSSPIAKNQEFMSFIGYAIPIVFIGLLYNTFRLEITYYWNDLYEQSKVVLEDSDLPYSGTRFNRDLLLFKTAWVYIYTFIFLMVLSAVNLYKLKNTTTAKINLSMNALTIFLFLIFGLYNLSLLRDSYLYPGDPQLYHYGAMHLMVRYVSLAAVIGLILITLRVVKQFEMNTAIQRIFDLFLHGTILWLLGSELINILDLNGASGSDKLAISILSGVYALLLVFVGIRKKKKHLRIAAFILFGITLFKLFFYDMAKQSTIAKTVVFVSLGLLLLVISFLYNRFKNEIEENSNAVTDSEGK